ncbi:MAG TPA: SDR family NAD(P)-dependent oxidoreductase [Bacteroidia bacterium]|jgi:3-hydroxy acid dehydrogenase/malonic semialdehyde reductase|nr:SDR family NAD(P)-dependent oxidoreductase [Bacteroidia bacterium]
MITLITGATSGIGKSTAEIFARNGYDLIITGRRAERLQKLADDLQEQHKVKIQTLCFDIRRLEEVKKNIASLSSENKNIDVLVNNAGLASGSSTIQDGDTDDWEKMIDTNIKGLLYITKEVANLMIPYKKGHIINVGSVAGKEVYPNGNVYCASKYAVDALNKAMRIDLLAHNIRVSAIHPGMVETEFSVVRFHGDEARAKKVYEGLQPLTPNDIADAIYWMASRPPHVNITDVIITPTAQANATTVIRK